MVVGDFFLTFSLFQMNGCFSIQGQMKLLTLWVIWFFAGRGFLSTWRGMGRLGLLGQISALISICHSR